MIKKVRICGQDLKIKVVTLIHEGRKNDNYVGLCKNPELEIVLARRSKWGGKYHSSNIAEHLLHEILHRVSNKYEVNLSEKQVLRLGNGLYQVLMDNKLPFTKKGF